MSFASGSGLKKEVSMPSCEIIKRLRDAGLVLHTLVDFGGH
jgi:hypothetical protein